VEWRVIFYADSKGREPVVEFFDSLPVGDRARVVRLIRLLAHYGVLLKEPYTRQIRGKLRELRIIEKGGGVRVIYFGTSGKTFVLLHGFIKKTAKTPTRDIETARKRMEDYLDRHGE
jgi:phage-related protein